MKRVVQSIIAACALASASAAAAQIINAGFEEGAFGDGSVRQISPDEKALPGWSVSDGQITWYKNGYSLNGNALSPHTGDLALNLCDGSVRTCDGSVRVGSLSQTIPTLPFQEYRVSYWVGNYSANGGPLAVLTTITDGTSHTIIFSEIATARASDDPSTWEHFSFNFVADGTSNTITFSEAIDPSYPRGVGPSYTGLDEVSVAAVPEPSTWALTLLGFAGLGMIGMRRRVTRLT